MNFFVLTQVLELTNQIQECGMEINALSSFLLLFSIKVSLLTFALCSEKLC